MVLRGVQLLTRLSAPMWLLGLTWVALWGLLVGGVFKVFL